MVTYSVDIFTERYTSQKFPHILYFNEEIYYVNDGDVSFSNQKAKLSI